MWYVDIDNFMFGIFLNYQGGGICPNSTTYCSYGCCGNNENHHCCYPIGVFIGCGFGVLGAICLLISILKCRLGSQRNQLQRQQCTEPDPTFGPEFGRENQAYYSEGSTIPSVTGSLRCLKYSSYLPPPSYEAATAGTNTRVTENAIT
ncbi:uncharacterized protein LOC128547650 [Mercenaria mercenaria]|uniref:uncharacterized protein LOC128547650 n=1 Tax=Mercenaria mercenaria TaxID=6596 RepID=UPI00234ECC96|nr:uncharacterized protein LOC128547650 [Mercenaria mercenaria]